MSSDRDDPRLTAYALGEMDAEERAAFEREMAADLELKREVDAVVAMAGALLYFLESSGYSGAMTALTGLEHKYSKLLAICVAVMVVNCGSFILGAQLAGTREARA